MMTMIDFYKMLSTDDDDDDDDDDDSDNETSLR